MLINWQVIPHSEQRYETCGDYWEDGSCIYFRTSKLSNPKHDWLLFLHEFVEYFLCKFADVAIKDIDAFDLAYEGDGEPGMDKAAPYHWQHRMADIVERAAAFALGVDWVAYDREVESLRKP